MWSFTSMKATRISSRVLYWVKQHVTLVFIMWITLALTHWSPLSILTVWYCNCGVLCECSITVWNGLHTVWHFALWFAVKQVCQGIPMTFLQWEHFKSLHVNKTPKETKLIWCEIRTSPQTWVNGCWMELHWLSQWPNNCLICPALNTSLLKHLHIKTFSFQLVFLSTEWFFAKKYSQPKVVELPVYCFFVPMTSLEII